MDQSQKRLLRVMLILLYFLPVQLFRSLQIVGQGRDKMNAKLMPQVQILVQLSLSPPIPIPGSVPSRLLLEHKLVQILIELITIPLVLLILLCELEEAFEPHRSDRTRLHRATGMITLAWSGIWEDRWGGFFLEAIHGACRILGFHLLTSWCL